VCGLRASLPSTGGSAASHGPRVAPTLKLREQYDIPAGAARLARILNEAGARVTIAGIVGDDLPGAGLLAQLESEGIDTSGVVISEAVATEMSMTVVSACEPERCVCEVITVCECGDETVKPRLEKLLLETPVTASCCSTAPTPTRPPMPRRPTV